MNRDGETAAAVDPETFATRLGMKLFFTVIVTVSVVTVACEQPMNSNVPAVNSGQPAPAVPSKPDDSPSRYPSIELEGQLREIFTVDDCQYISGLTCRIHYNGKATLPSEVLFVAFDADGRPDGASVRLIYPRLEPGERGMATLRLRSSSPSKIVLTGRWDGPWRNPY